MPLIVRADGRANQPSVRKYVRTLSLAAFLTVSAPISIMVSGANSPIAVHNGAVPTTLEPTRVDPDAEDLVDAVEDRPWIVIVWNDPVNLMSYVTFVLQKLFGYSLEKATELMLDIHNEGKAVVANGSREQAEMHVFRLHEHGLWATTEHDS